MALSWREKERKKQELPDRQTLQIPLISNCVRSKQIVRYLTIITFAVSHNDTMLRFLQQANIIKLSQKQTLMPYVKG